MTSSKKGEEERGRVMVGARNERNKAERDRRKRAKREE